jgi:hypothetical protein
MPAVRREGSSATWVSTPIEASCSGVVLDRDSFTSCWNDIVAVWRSGARRFVGCLDCGPYDVTSVCNAYGNFGSAYSATSIWNEYGNYGSAYVSGSPWNRYSITAPAIVDKAGAFYGYFSANNYMPNRAVSGGLQDFFDMAEELNDRQAARDLFCGK